MKVLVSTALDALPGGRDNDQHTGMVWMAEHSRQVLGSGETRHVSFSCGFSPGFPRLQADDSSSLVEAMEPRIASPPSPDPDLY